MSAAVQQPCTCPPESDETSVFMCLQHGRGRMSNLPFPSRPYHVLPTVHEKPAAVLPDDNAARNEYPMFDGLLAYFPGALAEVARVSVVGNRQHNPGEPLHWAREKSTDHANKILRHLADHGLIDGDGIRHSARLAWRALALLQAELEAAGWAPGRASRWAKPEFGPGTIVRVPPDVDARTFAHTLRGSVAEKMNADQEAKLTALAAERAAHNAAPDTRHARPVYTEADSKRDALLRDIDVRRTSEIFQ